MLCARVGACCVRVWGRTLCVWSVLCACVGACLYARVWACICGRLCGVGGCVGLSVGVGVSAEVLVEINDVLFVYTYAICCAYETRYT